MISSSYSFSPVILSHNTAFRKIFQINIRSDITSLLKILHWLPTAPRIKYKHPPLTRRDQAQTTSSRPPPLTPCSHSPNTTAFWLFHRYAGSAAYFQALHWLCPSLGHPSQASVRLFLSLESRLSSNISSSERPSLTSSWLVALISTYPVSLLFVSAKSALTQIALLACVLVHRWPPRGSRLPKQGNLLGLPTQVGLCPKTDRYLLNEKRFSNLTIYLGHRTQLCFILVQRKEAFHSSTFQKSKC